MAENAIAKLVNNGGGSKYIIVQDSTGATVKRAGNRNWRNNNPGNLQGSSFSYSQPGVIGKDFYGDPIFDTYENGLAAQAKLIFGPSSVYRPLTVQQAIYKYTPDAVEAATGQRGNPENTIKNIIKDVPGVTRNTPWSSLTPAQQQGVIRTINRLEGYKVGTISEIDPSKIPVSPPTGGETVIDPVTGQRFRVATEEEIRRNGVLSGTNNARKTVEPASESEVKQTINVRPMPNPLHAYASYTYGLSLAMLTIDEYNEVAKTQKYIPKRVLIASAGRHNQTKDPNDPNQFTRAQFFSEDFYFENLEIETVIGFNERSRATNAITINFSIIEPFGMSLLDRIIKLAGSEEVKSKNYLEQPYLLQIDFFAINDAGIIVGNLPQHTKRIPIKILTLDIDASNKGAVYKIEAVVYSHSAYNVNTMATPAHFEIVAGTVASFFQSTETESSLVGAKKQREELKNKNITVGADGLARGRTGEVVPLTAVDQRTAGIISADPIYKVKSYGSAYNAFYNDLVNTKKIRVADKIYFKFSEEFQNAKFLLGKNLSPKDTPMAEASTEITIRAGKTDAANANLDYKTAIFNVNAGTSIEMVINYVIRNSDYIQNQLTVPEDHGANVQSYLAKKKSNKDLPLKWFKIVPQVLLTEYDGTRKVWGREITYNVVPYEVYNTKIAAAPQGVWTQPLKQYNYYYTGKNTDVLDFKIQFNALYFTAVTAYKRHMAATYGLTDYDDRELNPDKYAGMESGPNAIQPMKESRVIQDTQARATGGSYTPTAAAAADVQQSLYTPAGGDMIQGDLRIIGDPQFIKQDDIFYPPFNVVDPISGKKGVAPATSDQRLIADGSLETDSREVYVEVTFKMPTDVNEVTGLVNFSSDYQQTSMFSGMYRVYTVKNTFSGGKFEQVLSVVRLPRQQSLEYSRDNQTSQRSETDEKSPVVDAIPAPKTTVTNNTATSAVEALPAPGNKPVEETAPPLQSAEQKELATVADKAEEKPITQATVTEAPPANPPTPSPSAEKLALKARADELEVIKNDINRQFNAASDRAAEITDQIERLQIRAERYESQILNPQVGEALKEGARNNLPGVKSQISALQAQLPAAEAEERRLRPLNLKASSDFVEAKSAYARAS
jgi:hypothetical protein